MLDIQYIRENQDVVRTAAKNKNLNPKIVDEVVAYDAKRREQIQIVEAIRAEKNQIDRLLKKERNDELISKSKELKSKLKDAEPELKQIEKTFYDLMLQVPNVPASDVPVGKDEDENQVVKTWGEKREFAFKPKPHHQLAEELDLYDSKRAVRIAGNRSYFLKNELVLLERAVLDYALQKMIDAGFSPFRRMSPGCPDPPRNGPERKNCLSRRGIF